MKGLRKYSFHIVSGPLTKLGSLCQGINKKELVQEGAITTVTVNVGRCMVSLCVLQLA